MGINILKGLYGYQIEAFNSTEKKEKGIIVQPTGTGKTRVQSVVVGDDIIKNPGFNLYVVNAPRIMLTYQLQKEFYDFLVGNGIDCNYQFVHSGGSSNTKELEMIRKNYGSEIDYIKINSSTNIDECIITINKSIKLDIPLILFSTYNSAEIIYKACKKIEQNVSIVFNDEAHFLVEKRFYPILDKFKNSRQYFFTATRRLTTSDNGRGMGNEESYGKVLFELSPRKAIDLGKMVRPRIHVVKTPDVRNNDDFDRSLNKVLKHSFLTQKKHFENDHKGLNVKMKVSVRGSKDIVRFIKSHEYAELRGMGVDIFITSSKKEIGNDINGEKVKRQNFLSTLKECGNNKDKELIVLHYDILSEGIDVPGLNTFMPLRDLTKSKTLQQYGRIARPHPFDRERMDSGEIKSTDINLMVKPFGYVILPKITIENEDSYSNIRGIIEGLRDYGFECKEDVIGDFDPIGVDGDNVMDIHNKKTKRDKTTGDIINEIISDIESRERAEMSYIDYLKSVIN
jgi:superfamily II DNA or RNA helicase